MSYSFMLRREIIETGRERPVVKEDVGQPSKITYESKTDLIRFEFKPVLMLCTFISVHRRQRQEGHEFDTSLHYTANSRPARDSIPISE